MRFVCLLVIALPILLHAQDGNYDFGARSAALAGSSITIGDGWSAFNNVGLLANVDHPTIGVSYQNRYNIAEFQTIGGFAAIPIKGFVAGLKYYKFGDDLYNQQLIGMSVSHQLQLVSLGLGANWIQTHTEGLQTRRIWAVEMGGSAELIPNWILGAHIFNLRHGNIHPLSMKAGISYRPGTALMINTEIEKQLEVGELLKFGMEYQVISWVFLRTGFQLQKDELEQTQINAHFGFGIQPKWFLFDYAFVNTNNLGATHEISLTYSLKK